MNTDVYTCSPNAVYMFVGIYKNQRLFVVEVLPMAWPGNKPDPKEIIGMTPEELRAKLDSGATKEDLKAITDQQATLQSSLSEIQNSLKALTTPKQPDTPVETPDDATVRMISDPSGFVKDATKDVREAALGTQAKIQELEARAKYGAIFAKYGDELVAAAGKFNVAQRAQNNFWDFVVRGLIGDKVVKGEIKENYPSLLGPSSVAPRSSDSTDPASTLDPEVAAFLKSRNVPLDKAARISDLMIRDGEPITHANYFGKAAN